MIKFFNKYYIFVLFFASSVPVFSQTIEFMSYNIRYDNPNDGVNKWENRKNDVYKLIEHYKPEIFGLQEGLYHQIKFLDSCLTSYRFIGVGRADGKLKGEFSPIFYNAAIYSLVKSSTFWLSENSETISVGWDAALERICTYGLFENKETKKRFWVFNTHFDHIGVKAREMSAKLILNKITTLNTNYLPVVFMGDLNSEPNSKTIQVISEKLDYGITISGKPLKGPFGTFTSFDAALEPKRIDYIFVKGFNVFSYAHIEDKMTSNNFISDHLPVLMSASIIN